MAKYETVKGKANTAEFGKSAKKGTELVSVIFKCDDGHNYEWQGYFTDGTSERTIKSLQTMGCTFPNADITNLTGFDSNEVQLQIEDTEYGKRVAWVNPIGGVSEENKMAESEKKGFASKMKGTLLRLKSGGAAPKLAAVPAAAPWQAPTGERAETPSYLEGDQPPMAATGTDGGAAPAPGAKPIPF